MIKIQVIIYSKDSVLDVSNIISGKISLTSDISKPDTLKLNIVKDSDAPFFEGDKLVLTVDDKTMFTGFIFSKSRNKEQVIKVTCFGELNYLIRNKDTYILNNMSASDMLHKIAQDYAIPTGAIADTKCILPFQVFTGQTLLDIILNCLDKTKSITKNEFIIKSVDGKVSLYNITDLKTDYYFSDNTNISDYHYSTSVSDKTYNAVKLTRTDKKSKRIVVCEKKDDANIKKWGTLQLYKKVASSITNSEMNAEAESLLKLYNKLNRSLTIDVLGNCDISAGNSIFIEINGIGDVNISQSFTVTKCTHIFEENFHTMSLDMRGDYLNTEV